MKNVILEGLKLGVRFQTTKGMLSTEQVCQYPNTEVALAEIAEITRAARKLVKATEAEDEELDFLSATSVSKVNKIDQLKFDILKEIYTNKKDIIDSAKNAKANKEFNEEIDALIDAKKKKNLGKLSIEALEKMRKS